MLPALWARKSITKLKFNISIRLTQRIMTYIFGKVRFFFFDKQFHVVCLCIYIEYGFIKNTLIWVYDHLQRLHKTIAKGNAISHKHDALTRHCAGCEWRRCHILLKYTLCDLFQYLKIRLHFIRKITLVLTISCINCINICLLNYGRFRI